MIPRVAAYRLERIATWTGLALAFLLSLAVLAIGNITLVNATGFEHSQHCLYGLLSTDLAERQVLAIGSSRMRHAVDPDALARALGLASQAVVNLSHPEDDLTLDAGLIDRVSERAALKVVVVEVHLPSLATQVFAYRSGPMPYNVPLRLVSRDYIDQTILVSRYQDLFATVEGQPLVARLYDTINLGFHKVDRTIKLLGGSAILSTKINADPGDDPARKNICFLKEFYSTERQILQPRGSKWWLEDDWARVPSDALTDRPEMLLGADGAQPNRAAIERIVRLGRERGFVPLFVYLPSIEAPDTAGALAPAFARRFGAPLITPPRALMLAEHYTDVHHLNLAGAAAVTHWLAPQVEAAMRRAR